MSFLNKIKGSTLSVEDKEVVINKFNTLIESGIPEKDAFIQSLNYLKEEEENNLQSLYNQLQ